MDAKSQMIAHDLNNYLTSGLYLAFSQASRNAFLADNDIKHIIDAIYTDLSGCASPDHYNSSFIHAEDLIDLAKYFRGSDYTKIREALHNGLTDCFVYSHRFTKKEVEDLLIEFLRTGVMPNGVQIK